MRITLTILALSLSFSAFSKDEIDYSQCQDVIDNMFQAEKVTGNKTVPAFIIDENGDPQPNEDHTEQLDMSKENGTYKYGNIVKSKKLFNTNKDKKKQSLIHEIVVKKDEYGRLFSIKYKGKNYNQDVEITYSKNKCIPKRVYTTMLKDNETTVTADIEACQSLENSKKDLLKKLNKAHSCLNNLNEYLQTVNDISEHFSAKISEKPEWAKKMAKGTFVNNLEQINKNTKTLTKKKEIVENLTRVKGKKDPKDEIDLLSDNMDMLIHSCVSVYGSSVSGSLFSDKKGIYEIKKEVVGVKDDNPIDHIDYVKQE